MHSHGTIATVAVDIVAATAAVAALVGYLPDVAAGMAILWYLFQFARLIKDWWRG